MNSLGNRQQWIGNLGRKPKFQYLTSGTAQATFSIAVNERVRQEDGSYVDGEPTWVDIVAYGKRAELVKRLLDKGAKILAITYYRKNRRETDNGVRIYHNFILREFAILSWPERADSADEDEYESDYDDGYDEEYPF